MCEFVFRYFTINRENENKLYCQVCLHIQGICYSDRNTNAGYTFTFIHLADAFSQNDLQYIQVMHVVPWELNPQLGVDRLSAPILSIFTIIDIGHFQNRFADNLFFLNIFFYYANKHTIYR